MAIDIPRRQRKAQKSGRSTLVSPNVHLRLLSQLYTFLARRTRSRFHQAVAKRLLMSKRNRAPLGLKRLVAHMKDREGHIACIVGTVTDDYRLESMPTMCVCALHFTDAARKRIEGAGGECLTFDQVVLRAPTGTDCVLLRGHTKHRLAEKYFGRAPGLPGSHTRPRDCSKVSH